jgi:hypothetical protein
MAEKTSTKKEVRDSKQKESKKEGMSRQNAMLLAVLVIIIVAVSFTFSYNALSAPTANGNFTAFWGSFASAPRAGIVINYYNSTVFESGLACSTTLIQEIQGSSTLHRNSSTLDFYVINSTSCSYSLGLGSTNASARIANISTCTSLISSEPRIVIGYSLANQTATNSTVLTIKGNAAYLQRCGIASEITIK